MTVDDSKYCVANRLCGDKGTIPRWVLQLYNVVGEVGGRVMVARTRMAAVMVRGLLRYQK